MSRFRALFSLALFVLTAFSSSSRAWQGPGSYKLLCIDEYKTALHAKERPLTLAEKQFLVKCELASLQYFIITTVGFDTISPSALPQPMSRAFTELEQAFNDLLTQRDTYLVEPALESTLLLEHGRSAVLPLVTAAHGQFSSTVSDWLVQAGIDVDIVKRLLCGQYCENIQCLHSEVHGAVRIQAAWDQKCKLKFIFDHLTDVDKNALLLAAQRGWPGPSKESLKFLLASHLAFKLHGDVRLEQLPTIPVVAPGIEASRSVSPGEVDVNTTMASLLRDASRRLMSFYGFETP